MSITSWERWARSPATPSGRTANCTRVRQPRPAPGFLVAGQGLDGDLAVEASQPLELLAEHGGLEGPLGGQGRVLPVAAPAAARASVRARRLDPVG